jgi:DNA uptake protein ComE-like DNA-binding protein
MSQLDEIEGFPQEAEDYFTLSSVPVEKLNVNVLTLNQLKRHPYLNFYQARAIVDYRRQYGHIYSLSDLHLLPDFTEEAINRLLPYVEY